MAGLYRRPGSTNWYYRFRYRGREFRGSCRTANRTKAQAVLRRTVAQAEASYAGERHGWQEAVERYAEEHGLRASTWERYLMSLKALDPYLENRALDEIDRGLIAEFVSDRKRHVTDATIRRDLTCLSAILSACVNWGWLALNPVRQFATRSLREAPARVRHLKDREELEGLLTALARPQDRLFVEVAVETGMRRGELLALEWPDVDFKRQEIAVRDSKTGVPRRVPMSQRCAHLLRAQSDQEGRVFNVGTGTALAHRFKAACRKAGIEDFRPHDLRHTFASWAVQRGHDLYRIGRILGHSTPAMTARYAHLRPQDLRGVVE